MPEISKVNRIAGFMRVKNDGNFVCDCVESCIDALDELIIVWNDCTDNSAEEIRKMEAKYPEKIKCYEYPYHILGLNISRKEFEFAKKLPEGSPQLFSTYSTFALKKTTCEYVVKIDADQIYFTEQLKLWCDFIRTMKPQKITVKILAGKMASMYLSLYRYLSIKCGRVLPMMPEWFARRINPLYIAYSKYLFSHDKAALALSGVNVLECNETKVSIGRVSDDGFWSLSPFNGEGDHLILRMNDKIRFVKFIMEDYNMDNQESFSVAELLEHPYRQIFFVGFFWKHIRSMRIEVVEKVLSLDKTDKDAFLSIYEFGELGISEIWRNSDKRTSRLFSRILFSFLYNANKKRLLEDLRKARKYTHSASN